MSLNEIRTGLAQANLVAEPSKPRALILDVDEVLLDWPRGFVDFFNLTHDTKHVYRPYYECVSNLLGFTREELFTLLTQFNLSMDFSTLKPIKGAKNFIEMIKVYNQLSEDPIKIFMVTKCGNAPITQELRKKNLKSVFGDFDYEIVFLNTTDSKLDELKRINEENDVLMFIDDFTSNCDKGIEAGVPTYAIKAYHNEHLVDRKAYLNWVEDMHDAQYQLLLKLHYDT